MKCKVTLYEILSLNRPFVKPIQWFEPQVRSTKPHLIWERDEVKVARCDRKLHYEFRLSVAGGGGRVTLFDLSLKVLNPSVPDIALW